MYLIPFPLLGQFFCSSTADAPEKTDRPVSMIERVMKLHVELGQSLSRKQ